MLSSINMLSDLADLAKSEVSFSEHAKSAWELAKCYNVLYVSNVMCMWYASNVHVMCM